MKKILFLTKYYPPHIGGVETHVSQVARQLVQQDFQVSVITEQFEPSLPLEEEKDQVRIYRIPFHSRGQKFSSWKWMWQHRQLLEDAEVIHVHDVFWWLYPIWWRYSHKLFITFHGWEGHFPPRKSAILQRQIAAFACQNGVVHVGKFIEKWYQTHADLTVYGGVDQKKITQTKTKKSKKIVFLGRLSGENDIEKVLQTMKLLKEKFEYQILWVGDGNLREKCEKVGKVTGFVQDPLEYLKDAKVVFASSYLSILEAQALGKIVCATYSHELKRDYLLTYPGSGFMLIDENPDQLADKIATTLTDQKKSTELVKSASEYALTQTWQALSRKYIILWQNKLSQSASSSRF